MTANRLWRWQGVDMQGQFCQGTQWNPGRLEVFQALQHERIIPLAIRRCAVKNTLWHPRYGSQVVRQLAVLLQAGLSLAEGWRNSNRARSGRRCCAHWLRIWRKASRFLPRWKSGLRPLHRLVWR